MGKPFLHGLEGKDPARLGNQGLKGSIKTPLSRCHTSCFLAEGPASSKTFGEWAGESGKNDSKQLRALSGVEQGSVLCPASSQNLFFVHCFLGRLRKAVPPASFQG